MPQRFLLDKNHEALLPSISFHSNDTCLLSHSSSVLQVYFWTFPNSERHPHFACRQEPIQWHRTLRILSAAHRMRLRWYLDKFDESRADRSQEPMDACHYSPSHAKFHAFICTSTRPLTRAVHAQLRLLHAAPAAGSRSYSMPFYQWEVRRYFPSMCSFFAITGSGPLLDKWLLLDAKAFLTFPKTKSSNANQPLTPLRRI